MSKNKIHDLIMIILGNFVVACSVSFFILPNNILTGGVAGVAVALHPVLPIDTVLMIDGLTIGLFILGALLLGKQFAMKSVISTIVYPVFVTGLSQVATMFPKDTFVMPAYVATIYAGVLVGIGLGLVFRVNSSTGGMDILALILHKYLKIPEGTSVMIVDGLTVLLGVVFVCGVAIDKTVMLGMQSAKNVMIISTEWKQIRRILLETVDRGVTILDGSGGYTQAPKPVLMCVIKQKQYPLLESSVLEIDPKAFIIVNDVHQVHGAGFTSKHVVETDEAAY